MLSVQQRKRETHKSIVGKPHYYIHVCTTTSANTTTPPYPHHPHHPHHTAVHLISPYLPVEPCSILPHLFTHSRVDVSCFGSPTRDPETDRQTDRQTDREMKEQQLCFGHWTGLTPDCVCTCVHVYVCTCVHVMCVRVMCAPTMDVLAPQNT